MYKVELMKKKSWLYALLVSLALFFLVERVHYFHNRGFRLSKLFSPQSEINIPPPCEVDALLNQSFHWMGAGGTCYVFLGEDQKTVLKFFKYHQLFYKHFLSDVSFPGLSDGWRIKTILSREKKHWHKRHPSFFRSCHFISQDLKDQSGLIYLCPQPNAHFNRKVKLIDAWGIPHHLNLNQTGFALQKKAELFFPYLEGLLKEHRIEKGKQAIDSLLCLIASRCQKRIGDRDPNLRINFGFIQGEAVEFDLGSYYLDPSPPSDFKTSQELFFITLSLQKWLEKRSPELLDHLLKQVFNSKIISYKE